MAQYDPATLSQDQRQSLWQQYGHSGNAPVGYGGEGGGPNQPASSFNAAPNSSMQTPVQMAQALQEFYKSANQPQIEALQGQIPTTQAAFAQQGSALSAQVDPLKQRYQATLDQLTASQNQQIRQTNMSTSQEFGKRGIPLSSGAYDQYNQTQTNPINQYYAGQSAGIQSNESDALTQLQNMISAVPIQGQQAVNQIQQAIGQLQSGNPSEAVTNALSQYQLQQQAQQNAAALALQQTLGQGNLNIQQQGIGLQGSQLALALSKLGPELGLLGAQTNAANAGAGASAASANLNNIQASLYNPSTVSNLLKGLGIGVSNSSIPDLSSYIGK